VKTIALFLLFLHLTTLEAQHIRNWGDQGDGTYKNPVLNADYSDPDVIRVGKAYYMVCSDFHYIGMQVLKSDDMVNWEIISQVYKSFDFPGWNENKRYAGGSWAPSIRYHDGKFWIYFCTYHEGLFMSNSTDPAGPWSPLVCLKATEKWEDPCPFWDEDGKAYLGRSQWRAGPIILHRMSADGTALLDSGTTIYTGPVAEGTKFYKKDGYYYLSIPEGGVGTGWQTVLRATNIYGPYEKKVVLEQGNTTINGPHQGALVDASDGIWWFYHFQSTEPLGRVVHLEPVQWKDGWPFIGVDLDSNGIGEPVKTWAKPILNKPLGFPQTSDDFSSSTLGLQWQFNHNPENKAWSLTERKGWLTLHALKADQLRNARNMFTQKVMGNSGEATAEMDVRNLAEGQRAGLFCLGNLFNGIGVMRENGKNWLYLENNGEIEKLQPIAVKRLFLRITLDDLNNLHQRFISLNGKDFQPSGTPYSLKTGSWKGIRVGLYSYNRDENNGEVHFNMFNYDFQ
jgi:beta-xylosidase